MDIYGSITVHHDERDGVLHAFQSPPLGKASAGGFLHEDHIGTCGFEKSVYLDGRHAVKGQLRELIYADISPFVFHKTSNVAKGFMCLGIVLSKKPCARSKGIE